MRKRSHADDTVPQVGDHVLYDDRSLADQEAKQRQVDLHRPSPAGDAPIVLADPFTQARMSDTAAQAPAEVAACATEGS